MGCSRNPPRSRKRKPVVIKDPLEKGHLLDQAVARIPGLKVRRGVDEHGSVFTVIGWIATSVEREANDIETRTAAIKLGAARRAWLDALPEHSGFVYRHPTAENIAHLDHLVGSYILRCDKLLDYGRDYSTRFTLSIFPSNQWGCVAYFDLAKIEGMMLIGTTDASVELLRLDQPPEPLEMDDNQGYPDVEPWPEGEPGLDESVADAAQESELDSDSWLRLALPETRDAEVAKRFPGKPVEDRFFFQFGSVDEKDEMVIDESGLNMGHIDFDVPSWSGRAVFNLRPFSAKPIKFTMHKVSQTPLERREGREWWHYSSRA